MGADHLLPTMADTVIGDRAFDADERVIKPLLAAGKTVVIPPRANRQVSRDYDRDLFKARHLIENFIARLKQFRAIATRWCACSQTQRALMVAANRRSAVRGGRLLR